MPVRDLDGERQEASPDTRVALDTGAALNDVPIGTRSTTHEDDDGIP